MTIPGHNLISTRNGLKSILLGTSSMSTKTGFGWKGWPQRRLDSSLQRFTGAIWIEENHLAIDREMKIQNIVLAQLFHIFPHFPSSIRQEFPLLVYLDPHDCIDARIFKVSWFLRIIFIVLCSTIQNGCSFCFFWVIHYFEMGLFCISLSRLVYFSQNFEEKILIFNFVWSPPIAPATVSELFSI